METLKDIFVPYEIAQKLKEIRFDEECVAGYTKEGKLLIETDKFTHYNFVENLIIENFNFKDRVISAPTWEQVKKWFRNKGLECYQIYSTYDDPITYVLGGIDHNDKSIDPLKYIYQSYGTYEQAREYLILKLIEIYKYECKK